MLLLLFLPVFCIIAYTIHQTCLLASPHPTSIDPTNTIIIFDIHGVLLMHDYRCMLDVFWQSTHKWVLLKTICDPRFLYHILKFSWRRTLAEAFFLYFAKNSAERADAWKLCIDIFNCQRVNWPMVKLAHRLKDHGYQLGILSNISEDAFVDLEARFASIFALFDPIITASAYNNFVTKPNPQVYQHLLQELGKHEVVMFIDDRQKNICGSLPFGIIALRFTDIHRLKEQLAALGVKLHS
jgi:FMN phosphatase YigB (HAD superfamily)